MTWKHIVTRESDLLERYLRIVGYTHTFSEESKVKLDNLLAISKNRLTAQYVIPSETTSRREKILEEYKTIGLENMYISWNDTLNKLQKSSEKVLETKTNESFKQFFKYYFLSRAIILYVFDLGEAIKKIVDEKTMHELGKYYDETERKSSASWDLLKPFFSEIAQKNNLEITDILNYTPNEFIKLIKTADKVSTEIVEERKKFYIILLKKGKVSLHVNDDAIKVIAEEKIEENLESNNFLKGTSTFKGNVKGTVRIVNTEEEMNNMQKGEILITSMTTPRLISAVKKATAIVTDEGGTLCHAAIISRELEIPCIVGTKNATKIFKDGDTVEVDANNGVVKRIK